jgi:hypothetical protein
MRLYYRYALFDIHFNMGVVLEFLLGLLIILQCFALVLELSADVGLGELVSSHVQQIGVGGRNFYIAINVDVFLGGKCLNALFKVRMCIPSYPGH